MWKGKTVSVVLGTYAERDSIYEVIQGYNATGVVDEIVVVNNNAEPGTKEEVERDPEIWLGKLLAEDRARFEEQRRAQQEIKKREQEDKQ